ncbi:MAG: hypothetical protein IT435_00795 [Phycisphaerales bacterium]|nr:hypothetical protein [Phycisphaerales bacterium]
MNRQKADVETGRAKPAGGAVLWLWLIAAGVAGGCAGDGEGDPKPVGMTDVFGRRVVDGKVVEGGAGGGGGEEQASGWAICLGAFSPDQDEDEGGGGRYEAAAHTAMFRAQAIAGLNGAYLEKRGNGLVLLYGSYESGTAGEAQRDLAYVRSLEVNGMHPYEGAFLSPPGSTSGTMPDYDLGTVKARRGTRKPLYTLQIAVYGRPDDVDASKEDLAQFRELAEKAVVELRREGEQAYYYHGPNRSSVTIGVFTEDDAGFGQRVRMEGAALTIARQKFPTNLLNGEAVRERIRGRGGDAASDYKVQASRLVEVPE